MNIRLATTRDIDAIKSIESESDLSAWSVKDYERALTDSHNLLMVVEGESDIHGFILLNLIPEIPGSGSIEILNIAVRDESRRKGFGKQLIEEAVRHSGFSHGTVLLEVRSLNRVGLHFYRQLGFTEVGRRGNYYTNPTDDAVLMNRSFNDSPEMED